MVRLEDFHEHVKEEMIYEYVIEDDGTPMVEVHVDVLSLADREKYAHKMRIRKDDDVSMMVSVGGNMSVRYREEMGPRLIKVGTDEVRSNPHPNPPPTHPTPTPTPKAICFVRVRPHCCLSVLF